MKLISQISQKENITMDSVVLREVALLMFTSKQSHNDESVLGSGECRATILYLVTL